MSVGRSLDARTELSACVHVAPHSAGAGVAKARVQVVGQWLHLFLPWPPKLLEFYLGLNDFPLLCSYPLSLCAVLSVPLSVSLSPCLPVSASPPPTPPCPCWSVLFFLGCRCSRRVPLRFWSQPKPSLPWRDGNVPRKVGIFLGSVLKTGCPGAWRSGGLSRVQTPGYIHGGIFFPSFSVPCSYVRVVLSLPQRRSTETGVCP